MSRVAELLIAAGAALRAMQTDASKPVFTEVRVELDRYDFADLLKESTRAPTARVCLLRSKPARRTDGGYDLDVSIVVVVVADREGRANPDFPSADLAALNLLDRCAIELMRDPYVGLGRLQAADLGEQLVVVSSQTSKAGQAITLMEVKWRLLEAMDPRPAVQETIALIPSPWLPTQVAINDGEPEAPPLGWVPPDPTP